MRNLIYFLLATLLFSCREYLDVKPDKKLVVPSDFLEAQSILNHYLFNIGYPGFGEVASDDYYLETTDWQAAGTIAEKNAYLWNPDVFNASPRNDWSFTYEKIYYANLVIDGIEQGSITGSCDLVKNDILGQAYFFRANSFYSLLQLFSKHWDSTSASKDLGVPLRLTADFNVKVGRSSVEESYNQLIRDLSNAVNLLNETTTAKTRPDRQAALALMARVFLTLGNYKEALIYSDRALTIRNELTDYNELNATLAFPFAPLNKEVIWHSTLNTPRILYAPTLKISKELLDLYSQEDLRLSLFFLDNSDGSKSFKGSYNGSSVLFNGLSISELYLIKAECLVRLGLEEQAKETLDILRAHRMKNNLNSVSSKLESSDLLELIIMERRKELLFRGLRWTDLRRLNKIPEFAKVLERKIGNETFTLRPDGDRYVFKIPEDVIRMSGIEQN
ncbi:RagB/SusD family nutrient uptake outer membrane protein [Leadbetterella byssophila]|uniref:RagB/SusD family nutrient uptake outer membrane protein n=1 Tax=Leadbetterella byssophila TaxID=316068 RepID=UPI0039A17E63